MISVRQQEDIQRGFQNALPAGRLHFSAHSHHPWPDVTESAHRKYWQDSAQRLDAKWGPIFSKVIPEARTTICEILNLPNPDQLIEGTSTFELVSRILSSYDLSRPLRILTTDSEFYSFERLVRRLSESANIHVDRVSTFPVEKFESRLVELLKANSYELVFTSLVFFNTGFYADQLLTALAENSGLSTVIVDIYHAAGALQLDLRKYSDRMFFVGGGYKYLSAGEGACFLWVPPGCELRPLMTGWLADYGSLQVGLGQNVGYPNSGGRFAGATYDPSGWYRFNAVMNWWRELGLNSSIIHSHVRSLQNEFLVQANRIVPALGSERVIGFHSRRDWGNFLTFPVEDSQRVESLLRKRNVFVDSRDGRLRIGFGYYHGFQHVEALLEALREVFSS